MADTLILDELSWRTPGLEDKDPGPWYYKCASTCIFRSEDMDQPCNTKEYVCSGADTPPQDFIPPQEYKNDPWLTAGTPAQQMQNLAAAIQNGGVHSDCPLAVKKKLYWNNIPAHKSGLKHLTNQILPLKDYPKNCPLYTLIFWSSIRQDLALTLLQQLSTRTGVRVHRVIEKHWPEDEIEYARCNAFWEAARLHLMSQRNIRYKYIQLAEARIPQRVLYPHVSINLLAWMGVGGRAYTDAVVNRLLCVNATLRDQDMFYMSEDHARALHDISTLFPSKLSKKVVRDRDLGYVWNGTVEVEANETCASFDYRRELTHGIGIGERAQVRPVVDGVFRKKGLICDSEEGYKPDGALAYTIPTLIQQVPSFELQKER
eukprot:gene4557-5578_t